MICKGNDCYCANYEHSHFTSGMFKQASNTVEILARQLAITIDLNVSFAATTTDGLHVNWVNNLTKCACHVLEIDP